MKVNYHILFLFFLVFVAGSMITTAAFAQYENDPSVIEQRESVQNPELNAGEEKVSLFEHERYGRGRDSSAHTAAAKPPANVPSKAKSSEAAKPSAVKEEEDALSFNFLYYIIQKFKISDLVDE